MNSIKKLLKLNLLILSTIFTCSNLNGQCDICGVYGNKYKDRIQKLNINSDFTFEYEFNGIYAGLMNGSTTGTWEITDGKLVLNSKYSNKDYEVIEKKIDHCLTSVDSFLNSKCDSLIRINVKNLDNEDIWLLKRVMVNNDTSQINTIRFENLDKEDNYKSAAFFIVDQLNSFIIFNGWYQELEIRTTNPNSNEITIKGNFSDIPWYTYFVNEEWEIGRKKIKGNKNFGNFRACLNFFNDTLNVTDINESCC